MNDELIMQTNNVGDTVIEMGGASYLGIGPQGPEGPMGPQGIQGPQGQQGIQGIQGIQGEKGDTGTFRDVTATVDGSTGTPSVDVSYDGQDVIFNFRNLKGPTGDRGQQGIQGTPGQDGEAGYSPAVTVTTITGGHSVKITDEQHPSGQTFNVMDGTDGQDGQDGAPGQDGANGITPTIGSNGNWYLGSTDTGKPSRGEQGQQGIQGIPGQDGRDGTNGRDGQDGAPGRDGVDGADGKSAYKSAQDGGYTGTEEQFNTDLATVGNKIDASGGTVTGSLTFTNNDAIILPLNGYIANSGGIRLLGPRGSNFDVGNNSRPLNLKGYQTRPLYNETESLALLSDLSTKADKPVIKTAMDAVATVNTEYYLGTQTAVNITIPTDAALGQEIKVYFKSGSTAATLTCDLTGFDYTPKANTAVLLTFRLVHKADAQVTGDEDEWTVQVEEG